MIKLLLLCVTLCCSSVVWAGEPVAGRLDIDLADKPALQDGARTFVNYCMGCHSTKFQRYEQVADDLGIPHDVMLSSLVFTGAKIADHMTISMRADDAKAWFGSVPPDLTLVARVRGADWLYHYLQGFYPDPARPWGVNNRVLPDVAMPNALEPLQNSLTPEQFYRKINNLVAFLDYSANPVKQQSWRIGAYVLLYLAIFLVFAYLLKREYWKDVH